MNISRSAGDSQISYKGRIVLKGNRRFPFKENRLSQESPSSSDPGRGEGAKAAPTDKVPAEAPIFLRGVTGLDVFFEP